MSTSFKEQRTDIQALRGLAVLVVLFYHVKLGGFSGGYLGVDVFFVISGFLITKLIASGIERGDFRLQEFYFRRAKRLMPAAYATFAVTAILAPWFLNQQELKDFGMQLVGAVTFSANFFLWQQTGYFEGAGDLKPLLHTWSLALEEQYYFLLPALLLCVRRSWWGKACAMLMLLSLGMCIFGAMWKPVATFYLLPTRAWELLIGSAGALYQLRSAPASPSRLPALLKILFLPALACLLLLPIVPLGGPHPGWNAMAVCLATIIVILRDDTRLKQMMATKILARVGDFSYSLYLVHWPLICFMKNAWIGSSPDAPLPYRLAILLISFPVAYALYRTVEKPARSSEFLTLRKSLVFQTVAVSLLLVSITPVAMLMAPAQIDFLDVRKVNYGFSPACEYKTNFVPHPECQNTTAPDLMVWGDSYAMHLVPGLAKQWKAGGVIQATRSLCGPFLGLAPRQMVKPEYGDFMDEKWAEGCIGFNQSVIDYLRITPSIKTVVLSSPFSQYLTTENFKHVIYTGHAFADVRPDAGYALSSLRRTVDEIRAMGKSVVLIAPPPSSGFNMGACNERRITGAVAFGARPTCIVDRAAYETKDKNVLAFLKAMSKQASVEVISFDPWLCDAVSCQTYLNRTLIYRDSGHLSYQGSIYLAERMKLEQQIATLSH